MKWVDRCLVAVNVVIVAVIACAVVVDQAHAAQSIKQSGAMQFLLDLLWWLGAAGGRG